MASPRDSSFHDKGVWGALDPESLCHILGIAFPKTNVVVFPPTGINKEEIIALIYEGGIQIWMGKLKAINCTLPARSLHRIFTYNLFPTTHNVDFPNHVVHVVYNILARRPTNIPAIIC